MKPKFTTERLYLHLLDKADAAFILEILNTPDFLNFIGDRKVRNSREALLYIEKISQDPATTFYTVKTRDDGITAGMVSVIKRPYLEHYDIGFAFLPDYMKKGYAYEASIAVLKKLLDSPEHECILATVVEKNIKSIRLLEKLGLQKIDTIEVGNHDYLLYRINKL